LRKRCHPALIDKSRAAEPAAKLDVLLSRIEESRDEDHKALVFSQFTSFLALVRRRLDAAGVNYEYLDGQTRDRASVSSASRRIRRAGCFSSASRPGGSA
jgi:SNF2 family DNA or RNA helicase